MSGINGAEGTKEGRGDSMEGWMEECATSDNNKGIKNAAAIAPLNSIDVRVQILEFRSSVREMIEDTRVVGRRSRRQRK